MLLMDVKYSNCRQNFEAQNQIYWGFQGFSLGLQDMERVQEVNKGEGGDKGTVDAVEQEALTEVDTYSEDSKVEEDRICIYRDDLGIYHFHVSFCKLILCCFQTCLLLFLQIFIHSCQPFPKSGFYVIYGCFLTCAHDLDFFSSSQKSSLILQDTT